MFSNIGRKIKVLAVVLTIAGICGSIAMGVEIMDSYYGDDTYGLLVMIFGSLLSWVLSFTIYGFGEIITHLKRSNEIQEAILRKMSNSADSNSYYSAPVSAPVHEQKMQFSSNSYGTWMCGCGTVNPSDAHFCGKCGATKR